MFAQGIWSSGSALIVLVRTESCTSQEARNVCTKPRLKAEAFPVCLTLSWGRCSLATVILLPFPFTPPLLPLLPPPSLPLPSPLLPPILSPSICTDLLETGVCSPELLLQCRVHPAVMHHPPPSLPTPPAPPSPSLSHPSPSHSLSTDLLQTGVCSPELFLQGRVHPPVVNLPRDPPVRQQLVQLLHLEDGRKLSARRTR